jgi:hypothetical protein
MKKIIPFCSVLLFLMAGCSTGIAVPQTITTFFVYPPCPNYAPSGMPDIDQKQEGWVDPVYHSWSFCGPTALANILWYLDSVYANPGVPGDGQDNFPLVSDFQPPNIPDPGPKTDDHNYNNINDLATPWDQPRNLFGNELVEKLAWDVDTNGCRTKREKFGTSARDLSQGCTRWLKHNGLDAFFKVEVQQSSLGGEQDVLETPSVRTGKLLSAGLEFESFAAQIEAGSYAAVLIFVYDPQGEYIFGHWITVAGINRTGHHIIISDPYFDKENPTIDPLLHNNVAIVSHDQYHINTTNPFSEDGPWWIEEYVPNCYAIVSAAVVITPVSKTIITKPATGHLSVLNKTCFRTLLKNTIIFGGIDIAIATDFRYNITRIELCINEEPAAILRDPPYRWTWDTISFGRKTITIQVYDGEDLLDEQTLTVWKFF